MDVSNETKPTEPGSLPSSEPTATAAAAGWKAPDNAPDWAKGKTADEILNLAMQMAESVRRPEPVVPPKPPVPPGMPTDDIWLRDPNEAARSIADLRFAERMAPALESMQGMAQMQAQTIRALASQQYADDFKRWAPEIDLAMNAVPVEQRTLDNYEKVVQYVRGKHVPELVEERARQLMGQGGLSERAGGSNGMMGTPANGQYDPGKLPAGLGEVAKAKGLTEAMVHDFCKKNGWTVERWMQEATSGKVFTSVSPFSGEMRDDQLGITREYGT